MSALTRLVAILTGSIIFGLSSSQDWVTQWHNQWFWLNAALIVFICYWLVKRTHWSVGLFALVMFTSALHAGEWPAASTGPAESMMCATLLILFFSSLKDSRLILELGYGACMISAIYTLAVQEKAGFVANASMNGCLIAMTWPLASQRMLTDRRLTQLARSLSNLAVTLLALGAVFYSGQAAPVVMITVMVAAEFIAAEKHIFILTAAIPAALGFYLQGHNLIHDNGRIVRWKQILGWWVDSGRYLFGHGTGTGQVIFPLQGITESATTKIFWAHNDYLQVIFENGVAGILALLTMGGFLLWHSRHRGWLFMSIAGYMVCMFFNSPMRYAPHAFIGACLIYLTYEGEFRGKSRSQV